MGLIGGSTSRRNLGSNYQGAVELGGVNCGVFQNCCDMLGKKQYYGDVVSELTYGEG